MLAFLCVFDTSNTNFGELRMNRSIEFLDAVNAVRNTQIPENVMERAKRSLLDYLAVTCAGAAFQKRDVEAAKHIEPLEEVVDDMVAFLKEKHMERLRLGLCTVTAGTVFLNLLSDIERISDICSDVGVEVVARSNPEMENQVHEYISLLHSGRDAAYNKEYAVAHKEYFTRLEEISR